MTSTNRFLSTLSKTDDIATEKTLQDIDEFLQSGALEVTTTIGDLSITDIDTSGGGQTSDLNVNVTNDSNDVDAVNGVANTIPVQIWDDTGAITESNPIPIRIQEIQSGLDTAKLPCKMYAFSENSGTFTEVNTYNAADNTADDGTLRVAHASDVNVNVNVVNDSSLINDTGGGVGWPESFPCQVFNNQGVVTDTNQLQVDVRNIAAGVLPIDTNVTQLGGNTIATGTGAVDNGTIRTVPANNVDVPIAIEQDNVGLATESTLSGLNSKIPTIATNTGNATSGTIRVVNATDDVNISAINSSTSNSSTRLSTLVITQMPSIISDLSFITANTVPFVEFMDDGVNGNDLANDYSDGTGIGSTDATVGVLGDTYIMRIIVYYEGNGIMTPDEFANLGSSLSNGIDVYYDIGAGHVDLTSRNIQTNGDWHSYAYDCQYLDYGAGNEAFTVRWRINNFCPNGILLGNGDEIGVVLHDDLSSLAHFYISVQGHTKT